MKGNNTKWRRYITQFWHFLAPEGRAAQNKHMRQASSILKHHLLAFCGELVGSIFFFGSQFAGVAAAAHGVSTRENVPLDQAPEYFNNQDIIYIATSNGLATLVLVWICFRISGAFFNPAISLASFLVGSCSALRGLLLMAAHTFGALIAAAVIRVLIPGKFSAFVQLGHGTTAVQGFFLEMFATTLLIFTALYSFRQRTKATYLSPILIGMCIFLNILACASFTGAAMNPMRAFAPAVIGHEFNGYHWIYWAGPGAGALLGALLYRSVNYLHKVLPSGNEDSDRSREEQEAIDEAKAKIIQAREQQADLEKQQQTSDQLQRKTSSPHSSQRTLRDSEGSQTEETDPKQRRLSTVSSKTDQSGRIGQMSRSKRLSSGPHKNDSNSKREQDVQGDLDRDLESALAKDTEQKSKPGQGMIWEEEVEDTALSEDHAV